MRRPAHSLATLLGMLVMYFAFPTDELSTSWETVLSLLGLLGGGSLVAALTLRNVRRHLRAEDDAVQLERLMGLVYLAVLLFSLGYYLLERADSHQFAGLETKVDALYFTVVTLATVGFGDVHPTGQLARALVTGQIVFNLVIIGALVSLLTNMIRQRAAAARESR